MWTYDRSFGFVRNADDWVIAHVPCTIGDESDHQNGELMAAAPAMAEHIKRLCTCLAEAVRCAQTLAPYTYHDALRGDTAIREAMELLSGLTVNP